MRRTRSNFSQLLVVFVTLMSLAPMVASFVAMYLLGAKSVIFRDIKEQAVERKVQIQAAMREEVSRTAMCAHVTL